MKKDKEQHHGFVEELREEIVEAFARDPAADEPDTTPGAAAPEEPDRPTPPPSEKPPAAPLVVTIDMNIWQRHDVEAKLASAFGGVGIDIPPKEN